MEGRRSPPVLRFPCRVPGPEQRQPGGPGAERVPGPGRSFPGPPHGGAGPRQSYRQLPSRLAEIFIIIFLVPSSLSPALSANFRRGPGPARSRPLPGERSGAEGSGAGRGERSGPGPRAAVGGGARPPRPLAGMSGGAAGWA